MSDIPFHIRLMSKLGLVKVTIRDPELESTKYPGFYKEKKKSFSLTKIIPLGMILPILLTIIPLLLSIGDEEQNDLNEIERIASEEGKLDWQKLEWDNPNTLPRLNALKIEIDNSSCDTLHTMFKQNQGWTLRAYVAHTILEKCQ